MALTGSFGLVADISIRLDLSPTSNDGRTIIQVALVLPAANRYINGCKDVLRARKENALRGVLGRPALPLDKVLEVFAALALVQNVLNLPLGRLVIFLLVLLSVAVLRSEGRV